MYRCLPPTLTIQSLKRVTAPPSSLDNSLQKDGFRCCHDFGILLLNPCATGIACLVRPASVRNSIPLAASASKLIPSLPCLSRFDDEAEGATLAKTGAQSDRRRDEFACTCSCGSRRSRRSRIRYMDADLRRRAVWVHWMTDAAIRQLLPKLCDDAYDDLGGRFPARVAEPSAPTSGSRQQVLELCSRSSFDACQASSCDWLQLRKQRAKRSIASPDLSPTRVLRRLEFSAVLRSALQLQQPWTICISSLLLTS
ncbi:LOW QUALITY PROTEIN: hypothetical protein MARPO_0092s0079 [Marchantia polymorpha]|uniref:Uncharacterized protein n=1 Tax=Marchantia polymorpha TaxID=3197 RepID=A0A2R6WGY7_MARPO|nr:LOW QUALITY PROTEIN: hypothetical protein MARPO_0092s0079 [Marchantia polymorpha]|eukprot:PTQ33118.1 LOW QUALITY PROTEIN: hypothetical protein MARPO_0092s0079 [Marchantia polymorpha]